ncbi:MAG: winged helix DNA-binding domain-containing protein [Nocardioides sp.]
MNFVRTVSDAERRARLGLRHALAPGARLGSAEEVTDALVVLHSTEPPTVHLSAAARLRDPSLDEVERALYRDRTLVKQLAMRRTLFVFARELLPAAWGSVSARVAQQEAARLAKEIVRHGVAEDGEAWVATACAAVLARLRGGDEMSATALREELPEIEGRTQADPTRRWAVAQSFAPRVLTLLGARGQVVRGHNAGHWRISKPLWTATSTWLGDVPSPWTREAGYAELVRRWLARFGPGTEADLVWWLGATKAAVRQALIDVEAVGVGLEDGSAAWLLPDDLDEVSAPEEWVALLPTLDPTTMGWRGRDFYLDPRLTPFLFDTNGNAGTTIWVDGHIVGAWVQDERARVVPVVHAGVTARQRALIEAESERLTGVLDGEEVRSVYKSALMKGEPLP